MSVQEEAKAKTYITTLAPVKSPLGAELVQICTAAFLTGPITWPLAATLLARQQGNRSFQFLQVVATAGVRRAYAGCGPYSCYKLFGMSIQRGVQLPVLTGLRIEDGEGLRSSFSSSLLSSSLYCIPQVASYVVAGVMSGVIGGVIVTPVEQFRISRANGDFASLRDMLRFFFGRRVQGLKALMSGTRITVYRNVLFDSLNCAVYNYMIDSGAIDALHIVQVGLANAVAGVSAAVIDYPLDVLKARIQGQAARQHHQGGGCSQFASTKDTASKYGSRNTRAPPGTPLALARHIIQYEGVGSLYGGLRHKLGLYFLVWGVYGCMFSVVGKLIMR